MTFQAPLEALLAGTRAAIAAWQSRIRATLNSTALDVSSTLTHFRKASGVKWFVQALMLFSHTE
jgi:hypothetical protein